MLHHADQRDAIDTFNMGLGWVAIVSPGQAEAALKCGAGARIIGEMNSTPEVVVEVVRS